MNTLSRRRTVRSFSAFGLGAALVGASLAAGVTPATALPSCVPDASATQNFVPGAAASYVVGAGITEAVVVAQGGSGSLDSGWADVPTGVGASVSTILSVVPGETLGVSVGAAAAGPAGGTSGGQPSGGAGSSYTLDYGDGPVLFTSGAGGGASSIVRGATPLVVAGGGGGGSFGGGTGGSAAAVTATQLTAGSVSAGEDGRAVDSEAGGGAGGGGSTVPGSGGAGVSDYGGLDGLPGVGGVGGAAQNIGFTPGAGGGGGGYAGGGAGGGGGYSGSGGAGSSYAIADYSISAHTGQGSVSIAAAAPEFTTDDTATMVSGAESVFDICAAGVPFAAINVNGELPPGIVFTDNGDGSATLSGTPGTRSAGSYPLLVEAENGNGTDSQEFTLVVEPSAPVALAKTAGDKQSAVAGAAFGQRLAVTVTDAQDNPVPDAEVTFEVSSGSGAFADSESVSVQSDESGVATSPVLTAGAAIGALTVTAVAGDASTEFGLTVTAVPVAPTTSPSPSAGAPAGTKLANTGFAPGSYAGAALLLLLAGIATITLRARRRRS